MFEQYLFPTFDTIKRLSMCVSIKINTSTRAREERRSEYDENQRGQRKEKKKRKREREERKKKMERALFGRATVKMRMHKCGNNNEPEI